MIKVFCFLACLILWVIPAFAADVVLQWDAVTGATAYKVYISVDNGATWNSGTNVGNVLTYAYTGVSDTVQVLFKVGALNAAGVETKADYMGAWWDSRKKPLAAPARLGAK